MGTIILWLIYAFIVDKNFVALNASPLNSKIIMGSPVEDNSIQYLVFFIKNRLAYCSGSLVSGKNILVAAYCVQKTREYIDPKNDDEVVAVINHKKYKIISTRALTGFYKTSRISSSNLGYIEIGSVRNEQDRLNAIAIPVTDRYIDIVGKTATIFGFHRLRSLSTCEVRRIEVKIENDTFCEEHIKNTINAKFVPDRQMCGYPLKSFHKIEKTDSGSPLIYDNVLIGVVTFRPRLGGRTPPITFMRIHCFGIIFPGLTLKTVSPNHILSSE